jgi:hypothetical protein
MRPARFPERKHGRQQRQRYEGAIPYHSLNRERLWRAETSAIDIHVQQVRTRHQAQEA